MTGKEFLRFIIDNPGRHVAKDSLGKTMTFSFDKGLQATWLNNELNGYSLSELLHKAPYEVELP